MARERRSAVPNRRAGFEAERWRLVLVCGRRGSLLWWGSQALLELSCGGLIACVGWQVVESEFHMVGVSESLLS